MKARVNKNTGEILSAGEGKYDTDPADVITGDIDPGLASDPRKLEYINGAISYKSKSARDQIDTDDAQIKIDKVKRKSEGKDRATNGVSGVDNPIDSELQKLWKVLEYHGLLD